MRKYLLAAAAAAAIASPAAARDGTGYIGIEGGLVFDGKFKGDLDYIGNDGEVDFSGSADNAYTIDFGTGLDVDLIAGYDFGMFRLEGELGWKRLNAKEVEFSNDFIADLDDEGFDLTGFDSTTDVDGKGSVVSGMVNGLVDFGSDDGVNFYAGLGVGRAGVKFEGEKDSAWAWQLIAGIRTAVTENIDLGVKYRHMRTGRIDFGTQYAEYDDLGTAFYEIDTSGKLRTHSLLASLIYNFAPPAPPPPPPPPPAPEPVAPAPATQTCYDGSVILATDVCPTPPPPPAPTPMPERG